MNMQTTGNFRRRALMILGVLLCFSTFLTAQQKTITGTIKDQTGEPVIGATIIGKGTGLGTATDIDGKFKLNLPANINVLSISYLGMKSIEVKLTGNTVDITLEEDQLLLDEVVVIGYGTQRKKDLTGAVSSVGEKALKDIPVSSIAEALTGKLAGVQVTTTEGSPDAEIKIRVRGGGSITQSNSPLYIVDGFTKDDIKDIPPTEILSIDVLKDASSTAIYGSRGANGVIIVTTKSGSLGKIKVSYNGYIGVRTITKMLDVLTPYQFAQKQYERAVWNNSVKNDYETYFGAYGDINLFNYTNATNWQKETFGRTGFNQNHTLAVSGGIKNFSYNASFNHTDETAIMIMSDYKRDNFSAKFNYEPLKWLKLDISARYAATTINGSGANDQTGNEKSTSDSRVKNAVVYTPIPLKNLVSQDDDIEASASLYSPIVMTEDNNRQQFIDDFNGNGGVTIKLNKSLSFKSNFSLTTSTRDDNKFYGLSTYYVREGGALKRDNQPAPADLLTDTDIRTFQNTNVLNYKKDNILRGHNLSVILGQELYNKKLDRKTRNIEAFPFEYDSFTSWDNLNDGTNRYTQLFSDMDDRMISFFGRLNYDIKQKYLLAVTYRADGSSKFSGPNKWGYFPSISAGWRISEEKFLKDNQNWLSTLKLRVSYGESGNNRIDNSAFKRTYTKSNSNYLPGSFITTIYTAGNTLANPDLKWETTVTRNIGLDFGFMKDRFNGSFELYSNTTEDVLIRMLLSGVGYTDQWQNAATTSNKGTELNLNAVLVQKENFSLNFSFNLSANTNTVEDLSGLTKYSFNEAWTSMSEGSNSYVVTPGQPVGIIYGFENAGMYTADDFTWNGNKWVMNAVKFSNSETLTDGTVVYKDSDGNMFVDNSTIAGLSWGPGAMKLVDNNGDGKITELDRKVIGNTNPKSFGAFSFSAVYKGFDAGINFNWVSGNQVYNASKIELTSLYYKHRNMLAIGENSYTQIDELTGTRITDAATLNEMNANATIWAAPTGRYATTSWAIEDGSFLRLNNLTIGYTLPAGLLKKVLISNLRVYVAAYNLYTFSKYSGYDPEVDTRRSTPATPGVDYSAYPKSRSFNFGVNVTF
jgi:TonB-linked SusC/RagA family outer membrane protein